MVPHGVEAPFGAGVQFRWSGLRWGDNFFMEPGGIVSGLREQREPSEDEGLCETKC